MTTDVIAMRSGGSTTGNQGPKWAERSPNGGFPKPAADGLCRDALSRKAGAHYYAGADGWQRHGQSARRSYLCSDAKPEFQGFSGSFGTDCQGVAGSMFKIQCSKSDSEVLEDLQRLAQSLSNEGRQN